jgi:hypothetical protein
MTRSASASHFQSEFDDFLFAPIGEERNGMLLSVLSALARLDVDPWQEAAILTLLPAQTAVKRLASLIAALPDGPSAHPDPGTIAASLVALLPRQTSFNTLPHKTWLRAGVVTNFRAGIHMFFFSVIVVAYILGLQWIASRQPSEQPETVHATTSRAVSPQMPPR